jgi:hypothetical protein
MLTVAAGPRFPWEKPQPGLRLPSWPSIASFLHCKHEHCSDGQASLSFCCCGALFAFHVF